MTVYLVGAGPGDPGLLTVRGAELLARADVVIHDRLSASALLDLAPPTAERISVGKTPRGPSTPQDEINRLLVEKGAAGLEVVRLKGGDPFVFARGGEEAAALAASGIAFEVVPGISSAIAAPAYAGVPVTYRGLSTSFTVVTGHEDPWAATETDWEAVARVGGTIVVLMGVATRGAIAERLVAGGLAPDTPVAAVTWGTRSGQRTVRTTLGDLGAVAVDHPAVIVIGAVAGLDLAWFEHRSLFGTRVQVTNGLLTAQLRALGADVVETPAITISDAADGGVSLRGAAERAHTYDWVLFTSATAVDRFMTQLRDARQLGTAKVAAIGGGTEAALARWHVAADLVAGDAVAEGLLDALPTEPARALLPRAAVAREVLPDGLRSRGWTVDIVEAYRTVPAAPVAVDADVITFMSSSAVEAYVAANGTARVPPVVATIGPVTSAAARAAGIEVTVEASPHSAGGVIDGIVGHIASARRTGR
jgi:uroporphyrinogen III methyltransferase/synthase